MAHQSGRHRQEMRSILPTHVTPSHQTHERFVDQAAGLKQMARALAPEIPARKLAQLRLHERDELVECGMVPFSPSQKKLRDFWWLESRRWSG